MKKQDVNEAINIILEKLSKLNNGELSTISYENLKDYPNLSNVTDIKDLFNKVFKQLLSYGYVTCKVFDPKIGQAINPFLTNLGREYLDEM